MKPITVWLAVSLLLLFAEAGMAQPTNLLDMGIFNSPVNSNKLEIRIKTTQAIMNGNYSSGVFTVRFPVSYNVNLSVFSSSVGYVQGAYGVYGTYKYYSFVFNNGLLPLVNWTSGQEIVVAVLAHSNDGAGAGIFELTNDLEAMSQGGDFYQELAANGQNGGGIGQQGIFYHPTTSAPLPVELKDFRAEGQPNRTVALDWNASVETDLAYYGIEHSTDGRHFKQLNKTTATGGPTEPAHYAYIHLTPENGTNYYRLRMVDRNGAYEYSPIRTVNLSDQGNFTLKPTPTTGPLALMSQHLEQYPAGLQYRLTDNTGKLLQTNVIFNEKTDFNLSDYAPGIYYLTIFTEQEQVKQFKVIVTRD